MTKPISQMQLHNRETNWQIPILSRLPRQTLTLPGSKSLTNRALVLAALACEPSRLSGVLRSADSLAMIDALRALGCEISWIDETTLTVQPLPDASFTQQTRVAAASNRVIDCGQAGTVMRFAPLLAALVPGATRFELDPSAAHRPQQQTLAALRQLGVKVVEHGQRERMPFTVFGQAELTGGKLTIDATSSSQFVSAILLVAPRFTHGLELRVSGRIPSLPHIEMTEECLRQRGIRCERSTNAGRGTNQVTTWRVFPGKLRGGDQHIEPDLTNAGPFLALIALAPPKRAQALTIAAWPQHTTQPGDSFRELFARIGARSELTAEGLRMTPAPLRRREGFACDMSALGELAPCWASCAPLLRTPTLITGIGHLRGHETDRILALQEQLLRLGVKVHAGSDWLAISPFPKAARGKPVDAASLRAARTDVLLPSYQDHRMVMFAAVLGSLAPLWGGPTVTAADARAVAKTFPDFPRLWAQAIGNPIDSISSIKHGSSSAN